MLPTSLERLTSLWLKLMAAHDPAQREADLWAFRDALHEHMDQRGKEKQQEAADSAKRVDLRAVSN
jgi:hypothetical protein